MSETHAFVAGNGNTCGLILEQPGRPAQFCARPITHPVHTGACIHCSYALDISKDYGDVCRFCRPHFGTPARAGQEARCVSCARHQAHS